MPRPHQLSTFSVHARFRHRSLVLRRGCPTLEAALEFAARVRVGVPDPESILVVDDRTHEAVEAAVRPSPGARAPGVEAARAANVPGAAR